MTFIVSVHNEGHLNLTNGNIVDDDFYSTARETGAVDPHEAPNLLTYDDRGSKSTNDSPLVLTLMQDMECATGSWVIAHYARMPRQMSQAVVKMEYKKPLDFPSPAMTRQKVWVAFQNVECSIDALKFFNEHLQLPLVRFAGPAHGFWSTGLMETNGVRFV